MVWYVLLIVAVASERLAELIFSTRNRAWSRARGGVEFGAGHYPVMVTLHTGLLAACLVEAIVLHRPFIPALGWPMLAIVLAAQGLRWWCIATLGKQWNTRVVVVPGAMRIAGGPYRFFPTRTMSQSSQKGQRCHWCTPRGSPPWSSRCSTLHC